MIKTMMNHSCQRTSEKINHMIEPIKEANNLMVDKKGKTSRQAKKAIC